MFYDHHHYIHKPIKRGAGLWEIGLALLLFLTTLPVFSFKENIIGNVLIEYLLELHLSLNNFLFMFFMICFLLIVDSFDNIDTMWLVYLIHFTNEIISPDLENWDLSITSVFYSKPIEGIKAPI
ncbi:hypothetical protein ACJX0J_015839 [Zea mays]